MNLFSKIRQFFFEGANDDFTKSIKKITGFGPKDIGYYKMAFTHKSEIKYDKDGSLLNYERLEFLGDALLDASITIFLYHQLPNSTEGNLTQMRSKIVSRKHLNEVGKSLNLVKLAKRPKSKRKFSYNAYGDLFEALVAAVYLDRGFEVMDAFIRQRLIETYVDLDKLQGKISSYKSLMIEWCQKNHYDYKFDLYENSGQDHLKQFGIKLLINNEVVSKGRSTSKKKAEELASRRAYYALQTKIDAVLTGR